MSEQPSPIRRRASNRSRIIDQHALAAITFATFEVLDRRRRTTRHHGIYAIRLPTIACRSCLGNTLNYHYREAV